MTSYKHFEIKLFYITSFMLFFFNISLQQTVKILNLEEGDVCRKGEPEYMCKRAENCESVSKNIKNKIYPDICSFNGLQPIICCSPVIGKIQNLNHTSTRTTNIVKEKCLQYSALVNKYPKKITTESKLLKTNKNTDDSGKTKLELTTNASTETEPPFKLFAVGGEAASPMEFPHMVLLGYGETIDNDKWGCGGSLISEKWILTAAHCEKMGRTDTVRWARLGELNIAKNTDNAQPKDYRIVQRVIHPGYKPPSRYNDIALFRLETDVVFNEYIRPICLNADPTLLNHMVLIATGWGRIDTAGPTSPDLLKVDLTIFPVDQCNMSYYSSVGEQLEHGILNDRMICAGSIDGKKDTCSGDSGGPLQTTHLEHPNMYTQFGITSFGKFCGDKDTPGVYTRVSKYISWIENIVWPYI